MSKRDNRKSPSDTDESPQEHQDKRSRSGMFKLMALALGVGIFLVLDLVFGSLLGTDGQKSFRSPHPYYHHGLLANQNRVTHWGGQHYKMITNSLGFRDGEMRKVALESDTPRVVVLGDSMMEGLGVEYRESVAGQLQKKWASRGVDVLNAGVVSYSPHLYYLKTRYLLEELGLQFDQLIVFIDISDIQDETFYEAFQPSTAAKQQASWWRRHSLAFQIADQITSGNPLISNQFRTDAEVNVWMEGTDAYRSGVDPEIGRWEWTVNDEIYEQWGKKGLDLARQHMAALKDLCDSHQVELTVVVYPSPVQIFANDGDSRQVKAWQEFCAEKEIRFVNLFPTFIDYSYSGPNEIYQRFFQFSDTHWNPAGHALVANKIDEEVGPSLPDDPNATNLRE